MTIASDISTISSSLNDIKNAIIAKGVTPSGNITTYASAIAQIGTDLTTGTYTFIAGDDTEYTIVIQNSSGASANTVTYDSNTHTITLTGGAAS